MRISGIQKNSFVDYPGKIAAIVFTPGCNMNCFFCHNRVLIGENQDENLLDNFEIMDLLKSRKKLLDGVVISGGEPTLQEGLEDFIFSVKEMGYTVKLDTNGTNPGILKKLVRNGMVDYIAMDIKAPMEKYEEFCGVQVSREKIGDSMDFILGSGVDYEFRTTYVPQLSEEDILSIAKRIKNAKLYALQQFRKPGIEENSIDYRILQKQHEQKYIEKTADRIKGLVQRVEIRGLGGNLMKVV